MLRLIGFLSGVLVAIMLLAAVFGVLVPERSSELLKDVVQGLLTSVGRQEDKHDGGGFGSQLNPVVMRRAETGRARTTPNMAPASQVDASASESTPAIDRPKAAPDAGTASPVSFPERQDVTKAEAPITGAEPAPRPTLERSPNWQPLWQAFRSELSAKGFADYLRRLTGEQYRVRRSGPWAYQVELAYDDKRQRDTLLEQIQTKTGLGMSRAEP